MTENISLNEGLFLRGSVVMSAKEVYDLWGKSNKFTTHDLSEDIQSLRISKKTASLCYDIELSDTANITVRFRNSVLTESQQISIAKAGYFILEGRLYFVHENTRNQVSKAIHKPMASELVRLVRELKLENRLTSAPENLTERLADLANIHASETSLFEKELYPYQKTGVDWLAFCTRNGIGTILADDMGLGKTAQVIALVCDTLEKEPDSRILVVVPNPLLENWRREFLFFAPSITPFIHYGPYRNGLASELDNYSVIITPYTTMTSDISMLNDMEFRLVLFDEASMLKNPSSSRSKAASSLNAVTKIAMTGTPVENSLMDVWSLSDLVFPGYLGEKADFKRQYVDIDIEVTLNKNLEELESSLRQITLRRMKKDVLGQLPEKQDIHIPVMMSEQERAQHDEIISEMQEDSVSGGSNILALINRLQQFTAHPALLNSDADTSVEGLIRASGKFEIFINSLDKIQAVGEKVLVFATFRKAIDLIVSAISARYGIRAGVIDGRTPNAERQGVIDCFSQSQGFDVLVLHPKTAGMGLNITAATHVIHYSRQWNPALEEQATARAWRNGQKYTVSVHYLFYANTVEEKVDERIRLKQSLSDRVVSVTDEKESDKTLMLNYLDSISS